MPTVNFDCALHAIDEQLSDRSPLDRMRVVAGTLLDALPRGRTFALCKECEQVVRGVSGHFFKVSDSSS